MRVKIGDTIYSAEKQPIAIELSDEDRINISVMLPGNRIYCVYPDGMSADEVLSFISAGFEVDENNG